MNIFDSLRLFLRNKKSGIRYRRGYRKARLVKPAGMNSSGEGLLFVTGFDKSGTTWLRLLLNDHPEITCHGCGQFFNYYVPDVHFLGNPGGFHLIRNTILESGWYNGSGNVWLSSEGIDTFIRQSVASSMMAFGQTDQTTIVGDKSSVQDCFLVRKMFPKAYIVVIVRDGRDVAVSFAYHFKRLNNPKKFTTEGKLDPQYLKDVAQAWGMYNEHVSSFASTNDQRFFLTKYEDLLSRPNEILRDLFTFLDVNSDDSRVSKLIDHNRFEVLSYGRDPGQQDENSFFRKGIAGDWVNHFKRDENSIFESVAGKTLRAFGYPENSTVGGDSLNNTSVSA